jgi:hypothetical protein
MNLRKLKNQLIPKSYKTKYLKKSKTPSIKKGKRKVKQSIKLVKKKATGGSYRRSGARRSGARRSGARRSGARRSGARRRNNYVSKPQNCDNGNYNLGDAIINLFS